MFGKSYTRNIPLKYEPKTVWQQQSWSCNRQMFWFPQKTRRNNVYLDLSLPQKLKFVEVKKVLLGHSLLCLTKPRRARWWFSYFLLWLPHEEFVDKVSMTMIERPGQANWFLCKVCSTTNQAILFLSRNGVSRAATRSFAEQTLLETSFSQGPLVRHWIFVHKLFMM